MTDQLIQAIAADLQGTCKSLEEVCEQHGTSFDQLTRDQLHELDNTTLLCEQCGWWCEACEFNNEHQQICDDCAEE